MIGIIVALFVIAGLIAATMEYAEIDEGERGIVITQGAIQEIREPGVFFSPFAPFTRVEVVNVKRQTIEIEQNVASKDKQLYDLVVAVDYSRSLNAEDLRKQYGQVGTSDESLRTFLDGFVNDAIKSASTQYTLDEALADRDGLANKIREVLTVAPEGRVSPVNQLFVTLDAVKVVDIRTSDAYNQLLSEKANLQVQIETENKRREQITAQQTNNRFQAEEEAKTALIKEQGITAASLEAANREQQVREIQGASFRQNPELFELRKRELLVQMMDNGNIWFIDPNQNLTLLLDQMASPLNPQAIPRAEPNDEPDDTPENVVPTPQP